jgi:hypothetical protein
VGPRHDRVELTATELRDLVALERTLRAEARPHRPALRQRLLAWLHRAALTLAPLSRLAPWLLPVGTAVMVLSISSSLAVCSFGAVLAACGMGATFDRTVKWVRRLAARHAASRPRPPS